MVVHHPHYIMQMYAEQAVGKPFEKIFMAAEPEPFKDFSVTYVVPVIKVPIFKMVEDLFKFYGLPKSC